jgi:hypothetical protein
MRCEMRDARCEMRDASMVPEIHSNTIVETAKVIPFRGLLLRRAICAAPPRKRLESIMKKTAYKRKTLKTRARSS